MTELTRKSLLVDSLIQLGQVHGFNVYGYMLEIDFLTCRARECVRDSEPIGMIGPLLPFLCYEFLEREHRGRGQ
jgi:hypothetical protein